MKTIGVLGGMGPAATLDFLSRLQAATGAKRDQDHVHVLVDLNPQVLDRNAALRGEGPSPEGDLVAMAQGLERQGAAALVMVCNSAHAWAKPVQSAVSVPLIDLIAETADAVAALGVKRAGVLAASAALDAGLYQVALAERGIEPLTLSGDDLAAFMTLLYRIKAGATGEAERAEMLNLAAVLIAAGAEAVVSGCTEVPLVLSAADLSVPLVNSTQVLVERTLAFARREG
ncbi:amino acid racemase [soil metagenome]